ncbi:protein ABHD11-like [Ylistrum balloti]|uniref:protein ABHD11-like n=1 Tax=Ylistrum balloti TaxID=509963 RepID=UPI002905922D|nr:protein ABHD11-like [Ylistrum balloti]
MSKSLLSKLFGLRCIYNVSRTNSTNTSSNTNSAVKLAHHIYKSEEKGSDKTSVVVMHGLMGSSNNWRSLSKVLCETGRKVIAVDARNHGESPHSEHMNYFLMSDDVLRLMDGLGEERVNLIGHSMGGKVFMTLALMHPQRVENLVVVDVSPRPRPASVTPTTNSYLHSMLKISSSLSDTTLTSLSKAKQHADRILQESEQDVSIRQFLITNLVHKNGRFRWRVNLDAIINNMSELGDFPELNKQFTRPTLFVGGENSDYIGPSDIAKIQKLFPKAEVNHIENAGHWVHAENPQAFLKLVKSFLLENDRKTM